MGSKSKKCNNSINEYKRDKQFRSLKIDDVSKSMVYDENQSTDNEHIYRSNQCMGSNTSVHGNKNIFGGTRDRQRVKACEIPKKKSIFRKILSYLAVPSDRNLNQRPLSIQKKYMKSNDIHSESSDSYINVKSQRSPNRNIRQRMRNDKECGSKTMKNQLYDFMRGHDRNPKKKFFTEDFNSSEMICAGADIVVDEKSQKFISQEDPKQTKLNNNKSIIREVNQKNDDPYWDGEYPSSMKNDDFEKEKPLKLRRKESSRLHFKYSETKIIGNVQPKVRGEKLREENEGYRKPNDLYETDKPQHFRQEFREKQRNENLNYAQPENIKMKKFTDDEQNWGNQIEAKGYNKADKKANSYQIEPKGYDKPDKQANSYQIEGMGYDKPDKQGNSYQIEGKRYDKPDKKTNSYQIEGKGYDKPDKQGNSYQMGSRSYGKVEYLNNKAICNQKEAKYHDSPDNKANINQIEGKRYGKPDNKANCNQMEEKGYYKIDCNQIEAKGNYKLDNKGNRIVKNENRKPEQIREKGLPIEKQVNNKPDNKEYLKDTKNNIIYSSGSMVCGMHFCSIPTDQKKYKHIRKEKCNINNNKPNNDDNQYKATLKSKTPNAEQSETIELNKSKQKTEDTKNLNETDKLEKNIINRSKPMVKDKQKPGKDYNENFIAKKQSSDNVFTPGYGFTINCCSIPTDGNQINKKRIDNSEDNEQNQLKCSKQTNLTGKQVSNSPIRSKPNAEDEQFIDRRKQEKLKNENSTVSNNVKSKPQNNDENNVNQSYIRYFFSPNWCTISSEYVELDRKEVERSNHSKLDNNKPSDQITKPLRSKPNNSRIIEEEEQLKYNQKKGIQKSEKHGNGYKKKDSNCSYIHFCSIPTDNNKAVKKVKYISQPNESILSNTSTESDNNNLTNSRQQNKGRTKHSQNNGRVNKK